MGFGVSIKLAPGVRVRASSRGIRASVGPRVARVHVGAGRTALSSGIGPFTSSTSMGARRRPTSGGRGGGGTGTPRTTLAALERQARQAQRETEIAAVARTEQALVSLHHEQFRPAQRVVLPLPPPVDPGLIEQGMLSQHLAGVSPLQRAVATRSKSGQLGRPGLRQLSRIRHIALGTLRSRQDSTASGTR